MRNREPTTHTPGSYPKTYKRAGEILEGRLARMNVSRWHLAILACVRRMGIDKGLEPTAVELDLVTRYDEQGRVVDEGAHVKTVRLACTRVLGEAIPMITTRTPEGLPFPGLEVDDLRRIAVFLARRVKTDDAARFPHYPDGWRGQLRWIAGLPENDDTEPRDEGREPGADEDDRP